MGVNDPQPDALTAIRKSHAHSRVIDRAGGGDWSSGNCAICGFCPVLLHCVWNPEHRLDAMTCRHPLAVYS